MLWSSEVDLFWGTKWYSRQSDFGSSMSTLSCQSWELNVLTLGGTKLAQKAEITYFCGWYAWYKDTKLTFIFSYIPSTHSAYWNKSVWLIPLPGKCESERNVLTITHLCTCFNLLMVYWALRVFLFIFLIYIFLYRRVSFFFVCVKKTWQDWTGTFPLHVLFFYAWAILHWLPAYMNIVWQDICFGGRKKWA